MKRLLYSVSPWIVTSLLLAPVAKGQDSRSADSFAAKAINAIRFADSFPGGTVAAKLDAAAADCGPAQCLVVIPSTMAGGSPTSALQTVTWLDLRRRKTLIGVPSDIAGNVLFETFAGAGTSDRVFGLAAQGTATTGGPSPAEPGKGEVVALFSGARRTGGTRPIWALNTVTDIPSNQRTNAAYGAEIDINNNDTDVEITDAPRDQIHGLVLISGGARKPGEAIRVGSSSVGGRWQEGALFANWNTAGLRIVQDPAVPAVTGPGIMMIPSSNGTNSFLTLRNKDDNASNWEVLQDGTVKQHSALEFDNDRGMRWKDTSGVHHDQILVRGDDTLHILAGNSGNGRLESQNGANILTWNANGVTTAGPTGLTVNDGVAPGGTGLKHTKVASCTTAAAQFATCSTTIVWPGGAFPTSAYTAVCTMSTPGSGAAFVVNTNNKTRTQMDVVIAALTPTAAVGTLDCIAMHS